MKKFFVPVFILGLLFLSTQIVRSQTQPTEKIDTSQISEEQTLKTVPPGADIQQHPEQYVGTLVVKENELNKTHIQRMLLLLVIAIAGGWILWKYR